MNFSLLALAQSPIQLVPDGTLLFHLAIIVVMVALLNVTLLKPINRILAERERRTKGRLNEAERTLLTVHEKMREYERRLRQARAEGYALMEQERAALSADRDRKVAEVKSEITGGLLEQRQELRAEAEDVRGKLRLAARSRALEISRQILRRPISAGQ